MHGLEILITFLGLGFSLWLIYYGISSGSFLWVPIGIVIALNGGFNLGLYELFSRMGSDRDKG